jgi:hypothetical protein
MQSTVSLRQQNILRDIIGIANGMDILDQSSLEFEDAYENIYRAIDKLDIGSAIDSPVERFGDRFDSFSYQKCRQLATELLAYVI